MKKKLKVGDIVQAYDLADGTYSTGYPYRVEIIRYNGELVGRSPKYPDPPHTPLEKLMDRSHGKVIGNMKENPELLTEQTYYGTYKLK